VVGTSEGDDELVLFLFGFMDDKLWHFLEEEVGVDECGFMSEKLVASAEVFGEVFADFFLEKGG
jgi:hypothetical protein